MDPKALLAPVIDAFSQAQVANYAAVSAFAVLAYDLLITQEMEIKHIWGTRWTIPKIMYLFCRYYSLIHLGLNVAVDTSTGVNLSLCDALLRINGFGPPLLANLTDALIIMRLRTMYRNSRNITIVLGVLFVVQALIEAFVVGFTTDYNAVSPPAPLSKWPGCYYRTHPPGYILAAWIPSLLFATTLFGMTLHRLWVFRQDGIRPSGLFVIFARDGAMFFAMIFVLQLLNTIMTAAAPLGRLLALGMPWLVACYGIVTSRLILNLREYSREIEQLTAGPSKDTTIEFRNFSEYDHPVHASRSDYA